MCPVCRGRGEVSAGVTGGVVEHGPVTMGYDGHGNMCPTRAAFPRWARPSPAALIRGEVWYLETNPHCELWGIAVCATCRGTGQDGIWEDLHGKPSELAEAP